MTFANEAKKPFGELSKAEQEALKIAHKGECRVQGWWGSFDGWVIVNPEWDDDFIYRIHPKDEEKAKAINGEIASPEKTPKTFKRLGLFATSGDLVTTFDLKRDDIKEYFQERYETTWEYAVEQGWRIAPVEIRKVRE